MLILPGSAALSEFRSKKLADTLENILGERPVISTEFVHFADLADSLNDKEHKVLEALLEYGPASGAVDHTGTLFLVTPRIGTISPWSSKATDIAHNCGLNKIERLERGVAYYLQGDLSDNELERARAELHDRMTEAVFFQVDDANCLFSHAEPQPFTTVDVVGGGKPALERAM